MRQSLRIGLLSTVLVGLGILVVPWAWERVFPASAVADVPATARHLDRAIDEVQGQIALDLRALGVGPGDIAATTTEERTRDDQLWTFTRTTVDLVDEATEAEIRAAFGTWPDGIEAFVTRPDELTWSVRIYASTFAVHQVLLRLPLDPEPALDPAAPPRLAVVLTGLGERSDAAERWIVTPYPLTLALRPYHSHTMRYATDAARASKEVAVQLDFDAPPAQAPPKMALPPRLSLEMEPQALRARLEEDLAAVPYASGAVLVQGSPTTRDATAMEGLAQVLRDQRGYLLDEGAGGDGVAIEMARREAVPAAAGAVRVAPDAGADGAARDLLRARNLAVRRGDAVLCVPVEVAETAALEGFLAERVEEGYRLVFASELITADGR